MVEAAAVAVAVAVVGAAPAAQLTLVVRVTLLLGAAVLSIALSHRASPRWVS